MAELQASRAAIDLQASEDELRALLVNQLEILEPSAFDAAVLSARRLRIPLERALIERARVPMSFLLEHLAEAWRVDFTDLKVSDVQPEALRKITPEFATSHLLVAFDLNDLGLSVAMWNPRHERTLLELRRMVTVPIVPYFAPLAAIRRAHLLYRPALRDLLKQAGGAGDERVPLTITGAAEPAAGDLLNQVLEYSVVARASDIHVEPYEFEGLIRCRVDGALHEVLSVPAAALPGLAARIKVLAGMRIDEKRAPQDGHFRAEVGGLPMDMRVSSIPTPFGEKIVMRIVAKEESGLDLEDLGLAANDYPIVRRHLVRPFGMILITGPTGSGKTTSLYAMLNQIAVARQNAVNISTVEDPVERTIPRVTQVAINVSAGIDFASGLRALLRQDPDIIMVGEIRDRETAEMAVRAAMVGRLLLSTLHTNDAVGAVPRLVDMGVEPFLVASTLGLVIGQRLARKICASCRESVSRKVPLLETVRTTPGFAAAIPVLQSQGVLPATGDPLAGVRLYHGRGCTQCNGTGFRGRVALFELFDVTDPIRRMIAEGRDGLQIRDAAIAGGMKTMFQDALAKLFLGETTIEEVVRATA
jgi:type IV pilus assembly protein PilB